MASTSITCSTWFARTEYVSVPRPGEGYHTLRNHNVLETQHVSFAEIHTQRITQHSMTEQRTFHAMLALLVFLVHLLTRTLTTSVPFGPLPLDVSQHTAADEYVTDAAADLNFENSECRINEPYIEMQYEFYVETLYVFDTFIVSILSNEAANMQSPVTHDMRRFNMAYFGEFDVSALLLQSCSMQNTQRYYRKHDAVEKHELLYTFMERLTTNSTSTLRMATLAQKTTLSPFNTSTTCALSTD